MPDPLHRISAKSGGDDPLTQLAVELADHVATCLTCRHGNVAACPKGMALAHAFAAKRLEVLGEDEEG